MSVSMREMLEAGVHFGHQTRYWNPKMAPYIFGHRNKIHIINLEKTLAQFENALKFISRLSANKGQILFVGTKRQARDILAEEAQRVGAPYVNHRWLGGMLTNFKTVKQSINRLNKLEAILNDTQRVHSKKELLTIQRDIEKLKRSLGGIREMKDLPDALFVIDTGYQKGAVIEANTLGIPVIGIVDTNNSPDGIQYVVPGNDDSRYAISVYLKYAVDAILKGRDQALQALVASVSAPANPETEEAIA